MSRLRVLAALSVAGLVVLASCGETVSPPLDQPSLSQSQTIDDQFIVVLRDDAPPGLERRLGAEQGGVLFTYETAIRGFAFKGSAQAAEALTRNPWVAYVEQDREATLHATQSPTPAWGIDRIDQRDLPLDDSYTYNVDGTGVRVYILDTGIRLSHNEFGNRANYIPNGNNGDFVCMFEAYDELDAGFIVFTNGQTGIGLINALRDYLVVGDVPAAEVALAD